MRQITVRLGLLLSFATATASAQIGEREFAARRDSLAKRIDSGVVIAFGGRTLVADFGTVLPDAGVPLSHELRRARCRVRDGRAKGCRDNRRCSSPRPIRVARSTTAGVPTRPR